MNTTQDIDHQILLHEIAIESLRLKRKYMLLKDEWGCGFFGDTYLSIVKDLSAYVEQKQPVYTEEERNALIDEIFAPDTIDYTLTSDMRVGEFGLYFTPENQ